MGGMWGAIAAMKQSLDQNRAQLKHHRSMKKQLDDKGLTTKIGMDLEFKKVSDKELEQIKAKIRKDAKAATIRATIAGVILSLIIAVICYYFLFST
ncbi:hypothetical protein [Mangrovibacterium diazotrophicum]|uniref:Uncharacterized protein n=1 Tax=Mangrovibacterium diazotrophicum TaxID=1261403 RepID=A0A419W335_9BACT|nr:hypothetical protein [Mangrovibacterium diazotrophicum]RKD89873.1 hypothetical protein BC643_0207 [Mangrovibacterium diazotrophicum]